MLASRRHLVTFGDGNFHLLFAIDPSNPAELAEAKEFNIA